jgi:hypothetical protein
MSNTAAGLGTIVGNLVSIVDGLNEGKPVENGIVDILGNVFEGQRVIIGMAAPDESAKIVAGRIAAAGSVVAASANVFAKVVQSDTKSTYEAALKGKAADAASAPH